MTKAFIHRVNDELTVTLRYETFQVFYPKLTIEAWHTFIDELGLFTQEYLSPYQEEETE